MSKKAAKPSWNDRPLGKAYLAQGSSLSDIARAVECDKGHLSRIIRGEAKPSPALADRLAKFFNQTVTRDQILFENVAA